LKLHWLFMQVIKVKFDVTQKEVIKIDQASTNSLALACLKYNPNSGAWIKVLVTDPSEKPYQGSYMDMLKELKLRTTSGLSSSKLSEVATILAARYTVAVPYDQLQAPKGNVHGSCGDGITLTDDKYENVPVINFGGYVVPANYPDAQVKIVASNVVDAFFLPLKSKDLSKRAEIDYKLADAMGFPTTNLGGLDLPGDKRIGLLEGSKEAAMTEPGYIQDLLKRFPKSLQFDLETGTFAVKTNTIKCTSIGSMYECLSKWRELRGVDGDARHEMFDGYYYGFPSRSWYTIAYMVQDILALGNSLQTRYLEISAPDSMITVTVLSSLVSQGWLIRVTDSALFPDYENQKKGVFKYFDFDNVYLTWRPIKEEAPKKVNGRWSYNHTAPAMIHRAFRNASSQKAFPFAYLYLSDLMIKFEKEFDVEKYPLSLFPTAHAHNGHIIIVGGQMNGEKLSVGKYVTRVSYANTYKTFYGYTKIPFFYVDPYAHKFRFYIRNKIYSDPIEDEAKFVIDTNDGISFDRVFAVPKVSAFTFKVIPKIEERRQIAAKIDAYAEQLKQLSVQPQSKEIKIQINDLKKQAREETKALGKVEGDIKQLDKPKPKEKIKPAAPPPPSTKPANVQFEEEINFDDDVPLDEDNTENVDNQENIQYSDEEQQDDAENVPSDEQEEEDTHESEDDTATNQDP
jgi:hypothetical protein